MRYLMMVIVLSCVSFSYTYAQTITREDAKTFIEKDISKEPTKQQVKKADEWVKSLDLSNRTKEQRLRVLIAEYLKEIRNWHNSHSFEDVPAGINPKTGEALTDLDRQIIIDSSIPDSVHDDFMKDLRKDLDQKQVEIIMDKYTIGKVDFTFSAYKTIVPDMTKEEEKAILGYLKQARAEAMIYKSMKEISAIFEIYKTKSENYFNTHGRNWRDIYQAYYDRVHSK